jgi:hypothetical protein
MYIAWLMNVRAKPPAIAAEISTSERGVMETCVRALASAFPGPEFTIVHQVGARPVDVEAE